MIALEAGRLRLTFEWPLDGQTVLLEAIFPDSYPRLRPLVNLLIDPSQYPERHCSPLDGNLCLLGRDTAQWPEDWTLADLLKHQLTNALENKGEQDPQGEPADFWWNALGQQNSFCLVDSSWQLGAASSGQLTVNYNFDRDGAEPFALRAVVKELTDDTGKVLFSWSSKIPSDIVSKNEIKVPWLYRDHTVLPVEPKKKIVEILSWFDKKPRPHEFSGSMHGRMFAVLHKIEIGPGATGLGWIFLIEHGHPKAFKTPKPGKQGRPTYGAVVPVFRAGKLDLGFRVPAARVLDGKKIVVVGAGAIGAPLAVDLARNGCSNLGLVDHDVVEPGNSIRWPLGASGWGKRKVIALAEFIEAEYPWCRTVPTNHRIGTFTDGIGDETKLSEVLNGADLVIDAATTYGVSTILSDYCRERELRLISFYASPPVTGGAVAYFHPHSGCPTCLEYAHSKKLIDRAPGFGSEEGMQQPPGCAEMTFTGASYDLTELSLQAMRLIIRALTEPPEESLVYTLSLPGDAAPPVWKTDRMPKMEECWCNNKQP